jgi:hypothetical protein
MPRTYVRDDHKYNKPRASCQDNSCSRQRHLSIETLLTGCAISDWRSCPLSLAKMSSAPKMARFFLTTA